MDDRSKLRSNDQELQDSPEVVAKLRAEPTTLAFVVVVGVLNIVAGSRGKGDDVSGCQRRRALSSSSEIVACSVGSASRRPSSSRCQSGTGTSAGEAVKRPKYPQPAGDGLRRAGAGFRRGGRGGSWLNGVMERSPAQVPGCG